MQTLNGHTDSVYNVTLEPRRQAAADGRWTTQQRHGRSNCTRGLDPIGLPPEPTLPPARHNSHAIVVCLSKIFVHNAGFVQKELHYALDIALEQPDGAMFLIPVRLEECEIPTRLRPFQWLDLFDAEGHEKLKTTLCQRAR